MNTPATIIIARDTAVDSVEPRTTRRAHAGDQVQICDIGWPGRQLPSAVSTQWAFWTSCDIDGAHIFSAEDVAELRIPDDPYWRDVLADAPLDDAPCTVVWTNHIEDETP